MGSTGLPWARTVESGIRHRIPENASTYCVAIGRAGNSDALENDGQQPARAMIKGPSLVSVALALIPVCALCFSVSLWDRITPRVLGLPFNIFWIVAWLALTPLVMAIAYRIEKRR